MPKKVINFQTLPYQWDFFSAVNRFPGSISAWGSGKTTMALFKGDLLSRFYKNNLGLIVRKKFTDLRDSTMKDFTKWTSMHIPQGTKEAKYANGSTVLFRHAKELSGLQNVNLGWVYVEQAEEFSTDTQFQLLRGRMRRELEVDENHWAEIIKQGNIHPFLQEMHDHPLRQMMPIANACGHNWMWKMFIKSPQDGYSCMQATSFDNEVNLPQDFIDDLRRMELDSPAKYKQYVMNCHDEIDLDACFYIELMNQLRARGHICRVDHDPAHQVFVSFDLGLDCTSMWFRQTIKGQKRIFDYYENTGKFTDHYARVLQKKGYNYGKLILPHDGRSRSKVSGESYKKAFEDLGYKVHVNKKIPTKDVAINILADALPNYYFDEGRCKDGLEALDHYRREYDEENRVYREKPLHDWSCLVASTKISTTKGDISIEDIRVGDRVITPTGNKKVLFSGEIKKASHLLEIHTNSGRKLVCTPEHEIFFNNSLAASDALRYDDILFKNTIWRRLLWKLLSLADMSLGFKEAILAEQGREHYIRQYGSNIMAQFLKDTLFITKIVIQKITQSRIWNCLQKNNITICTVNGQNGLVAKQILGNWVKQEKKLLNGMGAKKAGRSTQSLGDTLGNTANNICATAICVEKNILLRTLKGLNGVMEVAGRRVMHLIGNFGKSVIASSARKLLRFSNAVRPERVVKIVRLTLSGKNLQNTTPVYDLTIEDDHCYYANGILVSNSHPCDSLQEMARADKSGLLGSGSTVSNSQISKWQKQYSRTG